MSGTSKLAMEELRRFAASFRNVLELADQLAGLEDPAVLRANIDRLKSQSLELIANYRRQAETECQRDMDGELRAAEVKAKATLEDAEKQRGDIIARAKVDAAQIVADARAAGEELTKKFTAAHEAAHAALR